MIRAVRNLGMTVLLLGAALMSCTKQEIDPEKDHYEGYRGKIDPGVITKETVITNKTFDVSFPKVRVYESQYKQHELWTPELSVKDLLDVHLEVMPIYVFGDGDVAGDYYAINGYAVSHNASAFSKKEIAENVNMMGWYMSEFHLDFQLQDEKGNAVSKENVSFFVNPEPSTTIGETTYKKGFTFSLLPSLTFGKRKDQDEGEEKPSWKTTGLGVISIGFDWENSATQVLPDQSVLMWTGTDDRMVSYSFKTNNVRQGMSPSDVPSLFRNDQRVDFSWVWHVKSGAYSAKDRCFGNMKMKVDVKPSYKAHASGQYQWGTSYKQVAEIKRYDLTSANLPSSFTFDLPSMNRIPTGTFSLKNCTRSYLTKLKIYRTGEYGGKSPYQSIDCTCDRNESVTSMMREGTYDFYYELVNGDTGQSRGLFVITGVQVKASDKITLTTFNAKKV